MALVAVLSATAGILIYRGLTLSAAERHSKESAVVLVEKIKNATKLITVEGYLSELYHYEDYYKWDWWPFRKKVIIRVKARVSAGIDFDRVEIIADEENKTITLKGPLKATILSIDPHMDYYDLSEGVFNQFKEEDLTMLQKNARKFLEDKALESKMVEQATVQWHEIAKSIKDLLRLSGWNLVLIDEENLHYQD